MGQVIAWGLEAKNASPMAGTQKCEWFKLFLEPHALRDESAVDPRLPEIPVSAHMSDIKPGLIVIAARQEAHRSHHRLPDLPLGVR